MLQEPTIEGLARLLEATDGSPCLNDPLVAIRPEGPRTPFVFVPGIGGGDDVERLARYVSPDRPFYTPKDRTDDGPNESEVTIEALAATYVARVREIVPPGRPIALAGYSFGGAIAYEMAQRLLAGGHEVRPLLILDTTLPNVPGRDRRTPLQVASDTLLNLPYWLTDDFLHRRDRRQYRRVVGKLKAARRALIRRCGRTAESSPRLDIQGVFGV